jgi:hypothetical protein
MSDDAKKRTEDPGYVTIPPELRDFVPAKGEQPGIVRPGDNPRLDAAMAALRELNGGQKADPFYFDAQQEKGTARKPAPPSESVHVAAIPVPESEAPVPPSHARVEIAGEDETTIEKPPKSGPPLSLGGRTARLMAQAAAAQGEGETPRSPWAAETGAAPLAPMELPLAHAPGYKPEPGSSSERAAGVPPPGNRTLRVMIALAVIALLGFAAFQMMPKTPHKEEATSGLVPSATATVQGTAQTSAPAPLPAPVPPPVVTAEADAGAVPPPAPEPIKLLPSPTKIGPAVKPAPSSVPKPPPSGPVPMFERENGS